MAEYIKLQCIDGIGLMPENIVNVNEVFKNMIEDGVDIDMTPLNFYLEDIVNYIKLCELRNNNNIHNDPLDDRVSVFETSFFSSLEDNVDDEIQKLDPIGNIICISDFVNNEGVTDSCAKYIVVKLSKYSGGKDDIEMLRKILKVENDLTEEEEAKIRKANGWCHF